MAKSNLQDVMLEKGEKFALIGGLVSMGLFLVWGIVTFASAKSPDDQVKEWQTKVNAIETQIRAPKDATPLPEEMTGKIKELQQVKIAQVSTPHVFFDPVNPPDNKRLNPKVVTPGEGDFQADMIFAKIESYEILEDPTSGKIKIGVLTPRTTKDQKAPNLGAWSKLYKTRSKAQLTMRTAKANEMRAKGATGQPGGPMGPMGPMGGGEGSPGGATMAPPFGGGSPMGPMGMIPGGAGFPGGAFGGAGANSTRQDVEYVDIEDEKKMAGKRLAQTILPYRMIVVQAAFPYKEQLEEIRKALRLSSLDEVMAVAPPVFRGFNVERRMFSLSGKEVQGWSPISLEDNYRAIFMRKVGDTYEDPDVSLVMMPPEFEMAMPLPRLLSGTYPKPQIPSLTAAIKKVQEANKPATIAPPPSRLKGQGSIFAPIQTSADQGSYFGINPNAGEGGIGGAGGMMNPYGGPMGRGSMPGGEGSPSSYMANQANTDPLEEFLVRFVDADIRPNFLYQYRIQIKLENPNYQKKDLVSKPSDAETEILTSPWVEMPNTIGVPAEKFLYAIEPTPEEEKDRRTQLKDGQAKLQIQRWMPTVQTDRQREQVGDWVVAPITVTEGMYVGGKQFVSLPLWSPETNSFELKKIPGTKDPKTKGKEELRGVITDPATGGARLLVVDIDGGKVSKATGLTKRTVNDEAAYEVLVLSEDGTLQVHDSATDLVDADRKRREDEWNKWVKEVEQHSSGVAGVAQPGQPGRFE